MRTPAAVLLGALTLVLLPAASLEAATILQAAPERLAADTPKTTVAGHAFIAPTGWTVSVRGDATILETPEAGSRLALIDVRAPDAETALAAAWKLYDPAAKWPLKVASDQPDKDGWSKRRTFSYQTSPNERRDVVAGVLHAGDGWLVWIYDMAQAVGEKRGAQVGLIFDRLLPKGYARETFKGRTAHPLDKARIDKLLAFIEGGRKATGVPGVAIGLVQNGKVVFAGGSGVRELGGTTPVDADTLFMIASNTKALTTLLLARLVDQGKLTWDTPATRLLPSFRLGDAGHDQPGARQALDLRLHRTAAAGLRVAVPVRRADAEDRAGHARDDAADQQVRRAVPVLQPDGRRRRLPRRPRAVSRPGARRRLRQGDAGAGLRSARDDRDHVRLRARPGRQPRRRRTLRMSTASRRPR